MIVPSALSTSWIGVIGALGGVAITGLVGLVTAVLNHRWSAEADLDRGQTEVRHKRAELRRTSYARLMSAAANLGDALEADYVGSSSDSEESLNVWYQTHPDLFREMQIATNEAQIIAGDRVSDKIDRLGEVLTAYWRGLVEEHDAVDDSAYLEVWNELVTAMRQEQAIDLGQ